MRKSSLQTGASSFTIWAEQAYSPQAGLAVGLLKYLNAPPRYGERSGVYKLDLKAIPDVGAAPDNFPEGRYWLVNTEQGLIALNGWCTT